MTAERRPRLVIDIDEELEKRLNRFFRWGDRSAFFRFLIQDVLDILESSPENARIVMAAYITRRLGLRDMSDLFKETEGK